MVFTGKIEKIFPIMEMTVNDKLSKKVEFLLEYERGLYPKSIVIEVWNEKVDNPNISLGNEVLVEVTLKSRKVGDRFFNNITASKVELVK